MRTGAHLLPIIITGEQITFATDTYHHHFMEKSMELRLEMITCSAVPVQAAPGITKLILTCPSSVSRLICGFLFLLLLLLPLPFHSPLYTFSIIGKVSGKQDTTIVGWSGPTLLKFVYLHPSLDIGRLHSYWPLHAPSETESHIYNISHAMCHTLKVCQSNIIEASVTVWTSAEVVLSSPALQHLACCFWFSANQRFISPSQWIFFPLNGYKMQTHKKSRLTHKKF